MTEPAERPRHPLLVDAGVSYDREADSALLHLRGGKDVARTLELAPGVFCDEDADGELLGVGLKAATQRNWLIDAVILHYRAHGALADADELLLRHLAGGLRASLSARGLIS